MFVLRSSVCQSVIGPFRYYETAELVRAQLSEPHLWEVVPVVHMTVGLHRF